MLPVLSSLAIKFCCITQFYFVFGRRLQLTSSEAIQSERKSNWCLCTILFKDSTPILSLTHLFLQYSHSSYSR